MARRICLLLILLIVALLLPAQGGTAQARSVHDNVACADGSAAATFQSQSGDVQVYLCPAVVETGHNLQVEVHGRPYLPVRMDLQYPSGQTVSRFGRIDATGALQVSIAVRYNPPYRYIQVPFQLTVGKPGGAESQVVTGTITVGQAPPLSNSHLRVHEGGVSTWCPSDPAACTVHNGASLLIRVDTDAGAQVSITLVYPDGQSLPCPANELTGSGFADAAGVYRCTLPLAYQGKGARRRNTIIVLAQLSSGGSTSLLQRRLLLLPS